MALHRFHLGRMKFALPACGLALFASALFGAQKEPKVLPTVKPLPVALDRDFQFRKTKLFLLTEQAPATAKQKTAKNGLLTQTAANTKSGAVAQQASITFERQYRLFGAVTQLDQHQRFGNYLDFFWRAKRPADLTVRLEYRQEKLHAQVQAQEISYANARGNHKTEFKVVGDDYFDGGRVLAWRCSLIENGRVVAEDRSFLWK
jgi:hypothetical protein